MVFLVISSTIRPFRDFPRNFPSLHSVRLLTNSSSRCLVRFLTFLPMLIRDLCWKNIFFCENICLLNPAVRLFITFFTFFYTLNYRYISLLSQDPIKDTLNQGLAAVYRLSMSLKRFLNLSSSSRSLNGLFAL